MHELNYNFKQQTSAAPFGRLNQVKWTTPSSAERKTRIIPFLSSGRSIRPSNFNLPALNSTASAIPELGRLWRRAAPELIVAHLPLHQIQNVLFTNQDVSMVYAEVSTVSAILSHVLFKSLCMTWIFTAARPSRRSIAHIRSGWNSSTTLWTEVLILTKTIRWYSKLSWVLMNHRDPYLNVSIRSSCKNTLLRNYLFSFENVRAVVSFQSSTFAFFLENDLVNSGSSSAKLETTGLWR